MLNVTHRRIFVSQNSAYRCHTARLAVRSQQLNQCTRAGFVCRKLYADVLPQWKKRALFRMDKYVGRDNYDTSPNDHNDQVEG